MSASASYSHRSAQVSSAILCRTFAWEVGIESLESLCCVMANQINYSVKTMFHPVRKNSSTMRGFRVYKYSVTITPPNENLATCYTYSILSWGTMDRPIMVFRWSIIEPWQEFPAFCSSLICNWEVSKNLPGYQLFVHYYIAFDVSIIISVKRQIGVELTQLCNDPLPVT